VRLILNHKQFFYHKESRTFTAEISELREWKPGDTVHLRGKKDTVTYGGGDYRVLADGEGDIQGWELRPSASEERRVPGCKGTKVVIFND
jgi:hypothetical protein